MLPPRASAYAAPLRGAGQDPSVPAGSVRWSQAAAPRGRCQRWLVQFTQAAAGPARVLSRARTKMPGSVRLWLVRTAIARSSSGSQRTAERKPSSRPEWPSDGARRCRGAGRPGHTGPAACTARCGRRRRASRRPSPATAPRRRTAPGPSGRGRVEVDAKPPAPAAAVTTEVNGTNRLPSDRSIGRRVLRAPTRTGSRGRPVRAGLLGRLVPGVIAGPAARGSGRGPGRRAVRRRPARRAGPAAGSSCSSSASRCRA